MIDLWRDPGPWTTAGLAEGLPADDSGVRRLLERISTADDAEALRDVLTEHGARALLDEGAR